MSEEKRIESVARREFFRKAGLGAGAVAAGVAVSGAATPKIGAAAAPSATSGGYRETEHVKRYYELAKF
ncbi:MAG: formate dehydrogenase [Rhodospirillales bacterium]|nr:formate dehydrogenase [Rhodospirillales bacterium]